MFTVVACFPYRARLEAFGDRKPQETSSIFSDIRSSPQDHVSELLRHWCPVGGAQDEYSWNYWVCSFLLILQQRKISFIEYIRWKKKCLSFSWWKTKGSLHNYDSVFSACKVLFFCRIGFLIFDKSLRTLCDNNTEWRGSVQRLVQIFLKKSHIKESSFPELCFKFIDT